ncbi:MAG: GNAT family N-acetyltransferase [Acidimicrobiaceae bacterium]|nr:GNAT family N-acetyltransferase [Acidimicrobiaceae bacterium]
MSENPAASVRFARAADAEVVGRLLDQFNREFDDPSPGPAFLADRVAELIGSGAIDVLLGGEGPDAVAVLYFRPSVWSSGMECYLAELFVTPERRGRGLGRAMMDEVLDHARRRGTDYMMIGVDEPDAVARHLYESVGFTNRSGGPDGPYMFVYEREL